MSDLTIKVDAKDTDKAKAKAKEFFGKHKIRYTDDAFKSDKWAGRYRFVGNTLEITFTDRPWLAVESIIDPVIQEFFEGI